MDPSTSKKRKVDEDLDPYIVATDQILELSEGMRMLMRDADNLTDQLPASLLGLRSSLNEHLVNTAELKKRLDVAEQRSRLDSSRIQPDVQFGINPLYLTDIFLVGSSLQKNFVSKMNVPVDAKWVIDEVLVGDTCFEGNIYPGLKVNYMKILNFTGKKKFPHAHVCPFAPVCEYWTPGTSHHVAHLRSHFCSPVFFCFYCGHGSILKANFVGHLAVCVPYLTAREITAVVALGKSKGLVYSDFQMLARQFWNSGPAGLEVLEQELNHKKVQLLQEHFSIVFDPTLMLTLTAEFEEVLTGLCARCPNGNNGNVYAFFEITNGVPNEREAPRKAVYVGSECASEKEIGRNKARHRKMIEELSRKSKTFHGKIQSAKQAGRRFQIVDILVGIRSDSQVPICELKQLNFDLEKDKWSRPRHTLEDSFETMFGALSDNPWNINAVSRNRNNDSYSWPTEKRLLFGLFVFRRQWHTIARGLVNPTGII